jgi:cytochrome o ubiquinol oxidase subunit II
VINVEGNYEGFSSNYSGAGFSKMRFQFHGLSQSDFDVWVAKVRLGDGGVLDRGRYLELAEPSEGVAPIGFEDVDPDLFRRIVNRCVEEGRLCMDQMMALDAAGGTGLAGTINTVPAPGRQASALGHQPFFVAEFCTPAESVAQYGADSVVLLDPPPRERAASDETL